jgi:hypothetical protein
LKAKLGDRVKPIVVTDAGFKTPWFRQIAALGWDFLGRTRHPNFYTLNDGKTWQSIARFYRQAKPKPKARSGAINRTNPLDCRFIIDKQKLQGRKDLNRYGKARQSQNVKKYAKGARGPWLLSTSLKMTRRLGKQAVSIYRTRMQIEEEFRDIQSSAFGLGFEQSQSRLLRRLKILILLATVASLMLLLIGLSVIQSNVHMRYQVNTTSKKRVLSFQFVAGRAIQDKSLRLDAKCFTKSHLKITAQVVSMTRNVA